MFGFRKSDGRGVVGDVGSDVVDEVLSGNDVSIVWEVGGEVRSRDVIS